jgi:hypothetical protein
MATCQSCSSSAGGGGSPFDHWSFLSPDAPFGCRRCVQTSTAARSVRRRMISPRSDRPRIQRASSHSGGAYARFQALSEQTLPVLERALDDPDARIRPGGRITAIGRQQAHLDALLALAKKRNPTDDPTSVN